MDVIHYNRDNIDRLPDKPGVYKFFSENDILIYVGKAKSLKKRVKSYFQGQIRKPGKTRKLISEIKKIEITIVNSEFDAFLLENSLIKKHQPKYVFCGHIHEAEGKAKIGKTEIYNLGVAGHKIINLSN